MNLTRGLLLAGLTHFACDLGLAARLLLTRLTYFACDLRFTPRLLLARLTHFACDLRFARWLLLTADLDIPNRLFPGFTRLARRARLGQITRRARFTVLVTPIAVATVAVARSAVTLPTLLEGHIANAFDRHCGPSGWLTRLARLTDALLILGRSVSLIPSALFRLIGIATLPVLPGCVFILIAIGVAILVAIGVATIAIVAAFARRPLAAITTVRPAGLTIFTGELDETFAFVVPRLRPLRTAVLSAALGTARGARWSEMAEIAAASGIGAASGWIATIGHDQPP